MPLCRPTMPPQHNGAKINRELVPSPPPHYLFVEEKMPILGRLSLLFGNFLRFFVTLARTLSIEKPVLSVHLEEMQQLPDILLPADFSTFHCQPTFQHFIASQLFKILLAAQFSSKVSRVCDQCCCGQFALKICYTIRKCKPR